MSIRDRMKGAPARQATSTGVGRFNVKHPPRPRRKTVDVPTCISRFMWSDVRLKCYQSFRAVLAVGNTFSACDEKYSGNPLKLRDALVTQLICYELNQMQISRGSLRKSLQERFTEARWNVGGTVPLLPHAQFQQIIRLHRRELITK